MTSVSKNQAKKDWLIPAGLIVLGLIPALAGIVRVYHVGSGAPITPDSARFFAAPIPVVLHILFSVIYSFVGAFQFSPGVLRRNPRWHRTAGKLLVVCGMIVALTGIWMTVIFPIAKPEGLGQFDGLSVYVMRLLTGAAMAGFIVLGYTAIRRRDIAHHRAWMLRSYALGLGAGTQVFTHIPWFMFPSIHGELARAVCMAAGWGINLAVAEWFIARGKRTKVARPERQAQTVAS